MTLSRWIFLIGLFCSSFNLQGQIMLSGTIVDEQSNEVLPYAQLLIEGTNHFSTADFNGKFKIEGLEAGKYLLIVSMVGYETLKKDLELHENEENEYMLKLTPSIAELEEIVIKAEKENNFGIKRLNAVEGTAIYSGKKSEVIVMEGITANTATNNSRQIYSKIAGLNIWESDGAGLQLGIGGRGLNPNRVSSFNTRQNGYDISADALGYPESYYSPPAEALERIEIVRGAASLQYGTQFGGFLNFKLKEGPKDKPIELISRQTAGSFGFYNSFNSIGGTVKKLNYYSFYQYKKGDGWRPNSEFYNHTAYGSVNYEISERLTISADYTYMEYLAHQPGGLTDKEFEEDPRQSNRERNWFKVNWNLAALSADYKFSDQFKLNSRFFGLYASRSALGILTFINQPDELQERDLWIDEFKNFGNETRLIYSYNLNNNFSTFLIGFRYYNGFSHRRQGNGAANDKHSGRNSDFQFITTDKYYAEYDFPSRNRSVFAENVFQLNKRWSITPGLRFEYIKTKADGYYNQVNSDLAGNILSVIAIEEDRENTRSFILLGVGTSYMVRENIEAYGNLSQNYRSVNFSDIRTGNVNVEVDPNLKDEKGYTGDIGLRGNVQNLLNFDLSLFVIRYNNKIGPTSVKGSLNSVKTNIADARNVGIESFAEIDIWKLLDRDEKTNQLSVFTNIAFINGKYINTNEARFKAREVELVPSVILKTGLSYKRKGLALSFQYSYNGSQYTDATNAGVVSSAIIGPIPAYYVMDFSVAYEYKYFTFASGINNLTDNMYFTRRAEGYPGPGIIPSDGRSYYFTLQLKI